MLWAYLPVANGQAVTVTVEWCAAWMKFCMTDTSLVAADDVMGLKATPGSDACCSQ